MTVIKLSNIKKEKPEMVSVQHTDAITAGAITGYDAAIGYNDSSTYYNGLGTVGGGAFGKPKIISIENI